MIVELQKISKHYKDTNAVTDFSCAIGNGEFVSFLGPSGSGKTTLLNIISGIIKPDEGKVLFDNQNVQNLPPRNRSIGFVFQNYALYPNMTVEKNIEFPLESLKIQPKVRKDLVVNISKMVKVENLLNKKPHELSGGEQQRVAIARALVKKPSILLLDEPFSNLDPRLSYETRDEIKSIQSELKITTILVTHNQSEAMELSDKIAIISQGKLMQFGSPSELYDNPSCFFCADFLGDTRINSILGIVENGVFTSKDGKIVIDSLQIADGPTIMCIRPESIAVNKGDIIIEATTTSVSNRGKDYICGATIGCNHIRFYVDNNATNIPICGDIVRLGLNRNKLLFFCEVNGERK